MCLDLSKIKDKISNAFDIGRYIAMNVKQEKPLKDIRNVWKYTQRYIIQRE